MWAENTEVLSFFPHSESLYLQCTAQLEPTTVLPVLSVPVFKSTKTETWRKYVKRIDVMQLFSRSPSCLSHYSAGRYKQNNRKKNSLTGTWEAWWADLHSPVLGNTLLSLPLSLSLSVFLHSIPLFLSRTWSFVFCKRLTYKLESE